MNCPVKFGLETNYDLCIPCAYLGRKCNGPNLSVIDTQRWCDWVKKLKDRLIETDPAGGWSNAHIADLAGVSKPTVDRVMSSNIGGLTVETKYRISYAMIFRRAPGEDPAKYPCAMVALGLPSDIDLESIIKENKELKNQIAKQEDTQAADFDALAKRFSQQAESDRQIINYLKEQVTFKENQMLEKDSLLRERADYLRLKDKYIKILGSLLFISVTAILIALFADMSNPEIGFFWREALTAALG